MAEFKSREINRLYFHEVKLHGRPLSLFTVYLPILTFAKRNGMVGKFTIRKDFALLYWYSARNDHL